MSCSNPAEDGTAAVADCHHIASRRFAQYQPLFSMVNFIKDAFRVPNMNRSVKNILKLRVLKRVG